MVVEEVNIKKIDFVQDPDLEGKSINTKVAVELNITPELKREGLMREVIRFVQSARKKAELNIDDRIVLSLTTDSEELTKAIDEHKDTIYAETLTEKASNEGTYTDVVKVEGAELTIRLGKS